MLKRLEMHSICSHRETVIEFGEGKNVFTGVTGSGKTSILTAIEFAFLGPQIPGWHLGELITDGAAQGRVILDFVDRSTGQTYRIRRTIFRSESSPTSGSQKECEIVNLDTHDRSEGDRAVGETLFQLGFDPAVFSNVVYMRQGEFIRIVQESQEQKEVLDKLFKVASLENAHVELGKRSGPIQVLETRLSDLRNQLGLLKQEADKLGYEDSLLRKLSEDKQRKEASLREYRGKAEGLSEMVERLTPKLELLNSAEERIKREEVRRESIAKTLEDLRRGLPSIVRIGPMSNPLDLAKEMSSRLKAEADAREGIAERIRGADSSVESLFNEQQKLGASIQVLQSDIAKLAEQERVARLYLEGKGDEPEVKCDKCGTILTLDQWAHHVDEVKAQIRAMEERLPPLQAQLRAAKELSSKKREELTYLRQEEKALEAVRFSIKQANQLLDDIENTADSIRKYSDLRNRCIGELVEMVGMDKADPKAVQSVIRKVTDIQTEARVLEREMPNLERELADFDELQLKPQLRRFEMAREAAKKYEGLLPMVSETEQRISLLEDIRSTLRQVQPVVRKQFVQAVSELANNYFEGIYSGDDVKRLRLNSDYEFMADRKGHSRHAVRLSGGQRVAVSIAFLLALSELLSTTGFVILDEPTTHLDEQRRGDLVAVLSALQNIPQLIIVDHHPELKEAADLRFNVSLDADGGSVVEPESC
jgi:exonuclease SbcC